MRLISQNGDYDVPYEISELSYGQIGKGFAIYIRSKLFDEKPCLLATYTTKEKAIKAMEMVGKQYPDYCCNYHSQSGVFKFPTDYEIEV